MIERLQKFMASCGIASRRKCEEIILQGRVKVNNNIINELGYKINPEKDKVYVDSKLVYKKENKTYIMLNKPKGYVSTVKDERARKTIIDLIDIDKRIFPIGRLDYNTSGLILLTNDGDIYNKIIHPRQQIDKVYIATLLGIPDKNKIDEFCNGIDIGGYVTAKANFKILKKLNNKCTAEIIIHEGKNRQIRRMCEKIGHPVISLKRVSIGDISLGNLKIGEWRVLDNKEIKYLKNL